MTQPLNIEIAPSWRGRVDRRGGANACWPWTGALMTSGYGQTRVRMDGRWRGAGAHQVAHYVATGQWERAADNRLVRHLCHNRRCCNPAHLAGGTPTENGQDRIERMAGRSLLPSKSAPELLPAQTFALVCPGIAYDWHPSMSAPPHPVHWHPPGSPAHEHLRREVA